MPMPAEEGEIPLGLGPIRRSEDGTREDGAAPGSPWRRHGDRDGGSSRYFANQPCAMGMVGRGLQMFASMAEVDHLGFGRQGSPAQVQLSAARVDLSLRSLSLGRARLMCETSLASCAFIVSLPLSAMRPR